MNTRDLLNLVPITCSMVKDDTHCGCATKCHSRTQYLMLREVILKAELYDEKENGVTPACQDTGYMSVDFYCGSCGHLIKDTDEYCSSCGTKIDF
jgi:hypothetical protein